MNIRTLATLALLASTGCASGVHLTSDPSPSPTPVPMNIVAVGTTGTPTLFGDLQGSKLCKYVYIVNGVDPKTKKPTVQIAKGGQQYGGTGCIELRNIQWIEPLDPKSPISAAIQH